MLYGVSLSNLANMLIQFGLLSDQSLEHAKKQCKDLVLRSMPGFTELEISNIISDYCSYEDEMMDIFKDDNANMDQILKGMSKK